MHQPTSKELVRKFMQQRQVERKPPPSQEEVRRQLGWDIAAAEREANRPR